MSRNPEALECMIRLADDYKEADSLLSQEFSSLEDKFKFISEVFSFTIIGGSNDGLEGDYRAALSAIVNQKWRA